MKKVISIVLFSVIITFTCCGQTLIPKVGVSFSSLRAEQFVTSMDNDFSGETGYSAGLAYSIPIKPIGNALLSIQPEVLYVQKGFQVDAQGEFFFGEQYSIIRSHQEYSINYLEFPILAKYELGPDNFRFSLSAGPSVGFGLGGKYKSVATQTNDEETAEFINTSGDIRFFESKDPNEASFDHNIDFGLQAGAGVLLFNRILVDVRYGHSFTNLNEYDESKNKVVQFTVGVPIALK